LKFSRKGAIAHRIHRRRRPHGPDISQLGRKRFMNKAIIVGEIFQSLVNKPLPSPDR
jgi:hypothetical protein